MPLIVYLDSLMFMSELFGFMNLRHFCHTEEVKNNLSSGLYILFDVILPAIDALSLSVLGHLWLLILDAIL